MIEKLAELVVGGRINYYGNKQSYYIKYYYYTNIYIMNIESVSKKRNAVVANITETPGEPDGRGLRFRTVTIGDPSVTGDEGRPLGGPAIQGLGLIRTVTNDYPFVNSREYPETTEHPESTEHIVTDDDESGDERLSDDKDIQSTSQPLEPALQMRFPDVMNEGNRVNIYVYERLNLLLQYDYIDDKTYPRISDIMTYIIALISENFGIIGVPFITDKYISYLYNPLELVCIEMVVQNYKRGDIELFMRVTFSEILKLYCQDIRAIANDSEKSLDKRRENIDKYFNLLYNKLNSLIPVCDVSNNRLSQRFNYVFLYLTTIPAKLFIRIADLIWNDLTPELILARLQKFYEWYKSIPSNHQELSFNGFLTPENFEEYRNDILRINEISNITFNDLLVSWEQSRINYKTEIDRAIISDRFYPKIISNDGEISIQVNREEFSADTRVTEITFIIDRSDMGNRVDYDLKKDITGMVKKNPSNVGLVDIVKPEEVHIVEPESQGSESESQIGGTVDNGTFRDFLRVLQAIHNIINKTYTLPGDPTSIEIIKDGYINYEDGDFSGKKIVLDFLGMFMGAVINLIQHHTTSDFIVTSYFTYEHNKETNKTAYIQKYVGGDAIMAGYSPSELYRDSRSGKPLLKSISSDNDIKYGIDLYAFDDIELGTLSQKVINQIREKAYTELFQSFPSISPAELLTYNGWVSSEQPSSLSPFINLALTLDGTNLTQAPSQKFVTLTTSTPTKSLQSCFAEGGYDLSYVSIVEKIKQMLNGDYGSDYGPGVKLMTETFIALRKELIGLLVEQGEGILSTENIDPMYPAMDSNFKLALKNPDIKSFDYNYIYAYVYKNVIRGNIEPLFLPKCMTLLNSIMMTKIIESSASKNPSKDHGWSKLLNKEICQAYSDYIFYTGDEDISNSPIEDTDEQLWGMGPIVKEFNDRHMRLIETFYQQPPITPDQQPPITPGVFFIDYRDGTKSWGNQINGQLPGNIRELLLTFLEDYTVETCFKPCFTSRPTSKDAPLNEPNGIYENNCVTDKSINTGDMIYKIFAMDECHDTKPGGRTSLAVSKYIIEIADRSFKEIEKDLTCEGILKKGKRIDPKNPAMRKTRSWEAACANEITGGEFENALVANYGNFTKIDKNKLGITPEKASQIRGASASANTYNNAVFFGNENSGNAGTFVDGGTKKTVQNIHLPNICTTIIDSGDVDDDIKVELTVIVSYKLDIYEEQPQIRMLVSLIYCKYESLTFLLVTHEFVLGKGISCAQIYDDIYNNMRQQRGSPQEPYPAVTTRFNLTSKRYDPALAVLFVLKKTLCDWLQNFLKLKVHTRFNSGLGFSIKIKDKIKIPQNDITYSSAKAVFGYDGTPIHIEEDTIDGIHKVLMALERTDLNTDIGVDYLCIQGGTTSPFLLVPYPPNTKLFNFNKNPDIIPLINSHKEFTFVPYSEGTTGPGRLGPGCLVPRFHLFNYMNIFWDKYRSVYSPEHYRYISTLPSLVSVSHWKPDLCITGDILDLWISFVLTKLTFSPLYKRAIPPTSIIGISPDPFPFEDINRRKGVNLTNSILTMSGGATKLNANNRRKRKISYSTTKRKLKNGISKKKTKKSNQKKSKMKKSSKNHKKNKVNSNLTKKKYNR